MRLPPAYRLRFLTLPIRPARCHATNYKGSATMKTVFVLDFMWPTIVCVAFRVQWVSFVFRFGRCQVTQDCRFCFECESDPESKLQVSRNCHFSFCMSQFCFLRLLFSSDSWLSFSVCRDSWFDLRRILGVTWGSPARQSASQVKAKGKSQIAVITKTVSVSFSMSHWLWKRSFRNP